MKQEQNPPALFFDRLLDRIDPHQMAVAQEVLDAQLDCGRWLALHRMRCGRSREQLAALLDADPDYLLLIETGLADPQMGKGFEVLRYARLLQTHDCDVALIAEIVGIALGQNLLPASYLLARVADDLEAAVLSNDDVAVAQASGAPISLGADALDTHPQLVLDILRTLQHDATRDVGSIVAELQRQSRSTATSVAEIALLMLPLRDGGYIQAAERRNDPDLPGEHIQYYRITERGRQCFRDLVSQLEKQRQPSWFDRLRARLKWLLPTPH